MTALAVIVAATFSGPVSAAEKPIVGRATVIDGSTIQIEDQTIRLYGIIAPSARQKCRRGSLPWLCGAGAHGFLIRLTDGKQVTCVRARSSTAARCVSNKHDLALEMVRNGWAVPDKFGKGYRGAEKRARQVQVGLWRLKQPFIAIL
jgi:endonuclease YncB( thermonuclease family)